MKRNLLYLLMFVCSMSLFTACGDDDNNIDDNGENGGGSTELLPLEDLAGVYKGNLSVSLGTEPIVTPQNITISKSGDNAIKMELKNFKFDVLEIGDIVVDNCVVTKDGDKYNFTGEQDLDLTDKGLGKCPVKITKGEFNGSKLTIKLTVNTLVPIALTVNVDFDGTKLKGNESSEAKIATFTIDSKVVTEQPVIDEAKGTITFKVIDNATDEQLKALVPTFTISEKATVSPASGVAQDFSKNKKVVYTVVAEDGTVKKYEAFIAASQNLLKFSFEEWGEFGEGKGLHEEPLPKDQLASSVEGASLLSLFGIEGFPVYKSTDKKEGTYAIKLVTMDTKEFANSLVPAIVSGSVFTGKFDIDFINWETGDKLDCTRFGISYSKKPIRFKGWYKYTPGATFVDGSNSANIIVTKDVDQCAIQAVLYKVESDNDVLTGKNINDSPKRVAIAKLADGTAKAEYTAFDIPFTFLDGKSYEAGAKYKMAIVCSSSKEGDYFKGAGGSTLILDELEIIGE